MDDPTLEPAGVMCPIEHRRATLRAYRFPETAMVLSASSAPLAILLERVREHYRDMPGLTLTKPEATRLFGVAPSVCAAMLEGARDGRLPLPQRRRPFSSRRLRSGRFRADTEHTAQALLEKALLYQPEKQDPAHLPIEASPLRCGGGGEPHAGRLDEHTLQACERFCDTPGLVQRLDIRPCLTGL